MSLPLADILNLGASIHLYSNTAGRTHANLSDIMIALEDMDVSLDQLQNYCKDDIELDVPALKGRNF